jgi:hypothetical protein
MPRRSNLEHRPTQVGILFELLRRQTARWVSLPFAKNICF